jgi:hypothetical protein
MSDAEEFAPRRVANTEVHRLDITGHHFPWRDDAPLLVHLDGTHDYFLPLFTSEQKLRDMMHVFSIEMDSIKHIDDGPEFLDCIPTEFATGERLRIMVDPYRAADGKTRFIELLRGDLSALDEE